jgi:hypothetical protein
VQLLVGLVLYALLSPFARAFFAAPALAMKDPVLRFFGVEHTVTMLIAVVVLHVGRSRSKRAPTPRLRHRRAWTLTLAALLLMLIAVPWPFLDVGRPLLRML